jgi:hypothetical protein
VLRSFLLTTERDRKCARNRAPREPQLTRWRPGDMILRWTAIGLIHGKQNFAAFVAIAICSCSNVSCALNHRSLI